MLENIENRIRIGETFIIRDASNMLKPRLAMVIDEGKDKSDGKSYQRVILRAMMPPRGSYEVDTSRRMSDGIYTNRDNRYLFFRAQVIGVESISQFFKV